MFDNLNLLYNTNDYPTHTANIRDSEINTINLELNNINNHDINNLSLLNLTNNKVNDETESNY